VTSNMVSRVLCEENLLQPPLVPAAIDAVKQWRYRPFLLNGEPMEMETTITVNFELSY
jgi:Gram-negative bacterial TonB protein C-terminal